MSPALQPHILVLCTANRCRSPVAEALLVRGLASRGLHARVSSAGFLDAGEPVPDTGVAVAREFGLSLGEHRSLRVDASALESADLVLGMARVHARDAVAMAPSVWPRTFTLKQFRRWVTEVDPPSAVPLRDWLDSAGGDRSRAVLIGARPDDDVPDPIGRSQRFWRKVVASVESETEAVLDSLAPMLRGRHG